MVAVITRTLGMHGINLLLLIPHALCTLGAINAIHPSCPCYNSYIIINTGQNICGTKFLPTRPSGEIGENFLLMKVYDITLYIIQV